MSEFELYFTLGLQHILDIQGYDHLLFLIALCASYRVKEFKSVLILITSFTIGHSFSLALSTLNYIIISKSLVEFLIPLTILITALGNISQLSHKKRNVQYGITLFFGLIHGVGFSNYLKILLGKESSILQPLFAFNIGIEVGQLIIVAVYFIIVYIYHRYVSKNHNYWKLSVSFLAGVLALFLMLRPYFF